MAYRTLEEFSITSKVIEFGPNKLVPCLQFNFKCDAPIADGDKISLTHQLAPENFPNTLCACGFAVADQYKEDVFPGGCIEETGILLSTTYLGINVQYRSYLRPGSRGFGIGMELYMGTTLTNYLSCPAGVIGRLDIYNVRPVIIFYDVTGNKYVGESVHGWNVEALDQDFPVNIFGVIKANTVPQYVIKNTELRTTESDTGFDLTFDYNGAANAFLQNTVFDYDSYTPYEGGSTSEQESGPSLGDWDLPADEISDAGTPYNDLDTWLYRVYAMTANQVREFSEQLWNVNVLDIISRYFEKPQDVVISLKSFPFDVACGADTNIGFNWISQWSSVNVTGGPVTKEIQTLDFGTVYVPRYSDCFYDYQPYSSLQVHLPYIGFIPLKMNEIVGKTISLKYFVDVVTGDFTAQLEIVNSDNNLTKIGAYQGMISKSLPLSSQDMFSLLKKGAEISIGAIGAGTAGLAAATTGSSATKAGVEAINFAEAGNMSMADVYKGISDSYEQREQQYGQMAVRRAQHAGENFMATIGQSNTPITRSGNIDGNNGRTSFQEAFFIMSVPHQNQPGNNMQKILGFPANAAGPLVNFDGKGFTTVREIRLSSTKATINELAEIERLVQGGIIL